VSRTNDVPRLQLIREAARRHFTERGYEAASMREIADAAGIRISTLYFHCTTKEQLLFDLLLAELEEITAQLHERIAAAGPSSVDRLAAAISYHVQACATFTFGATVHQTDLRRLGRAHHRKIMLLRDTYEGIFRELVSQGITAGEFRQIDPKLITFSIVGTGLTVARWYRSQGPLTAQEIGTVYGDLFVRALRADGPSKGSR
jgi:TetR/AcrR family transcriptional regulator, cholesterol catabolism regulator